jgi:hypothetical protein
MASSATPAPAPSEPGPLHASVAFLRIPRFATRGVSEQAALKQELEASVHTAIAPYAEADRAVLDAEDGVAVVMFGDPARALDAMEGLHGRSGAVLQIGVNYGPLALTERGAGARVFGDGLTAAAAAARFATAERVLVTEDFSRALALRDPERAAGLAPAGDFTDTRVRLHSLYAPDPARRSAYRRRMVAYGVAGVIAIVSLGFGARAVRQALAPPEPAVVMLAIKPRGDVFVDGVARGRTPPLAQLEVPPGRHVFVIRHSGYAPLQRTYDLKAGERLTLSHTFTAARPPEQPPQSDFWRDLRRRFGGS